MGLRLKKEDTVLVTTGKDKGKRGRVLSVDEGKVIVERVNLIKRHQKPNKQHQQGGIIEKEAPLALSNVTLICPKCDKPTRIGNKILDDGRKLRACQKCKEVID